MQTVYELIQELSQQSADTIVDFHVKTDFDVDVEAEFDRDNEDDVQNVTVTASFDENVDYDDVTDNGKDGYGRPHITINLEY